MNFPRTYIQAEPAIAWSRHHFDDFGQPLVASPFEIVLDRWLRPGLASVIELVMVTAGLAVLNNANGKERRANVSSRLELGS